MYLMRIFSRILVVVTIAALAVSGCVAVADFIIQEIKENKSAKAAEKKWKKSH